MPSSYSGNPSSFPAAVTLPSDGDLETAASVNGAFQGLADSAAWLHARVGLGGLLTWSTPHTAGSYGPFAVTYSDYDQQWVGTYSTGTTWNVYHGTFGQNDWTILAASSVSSAAAPAAIAARPNGLICVGTYSGSTLAFYSNTLSAPGAWITFGSTTVAATDVQIAWLGTKFIATVGTASGTSILGYLSTTLTLVTGATPPAAARWTLAVSATKALAAPVGGNTVYTTGDGITWASTTIPYATGETTQCSCYDSVRGVFVVMTAVVTTGPNNVWTSPDGVSWTKIGGTTSARQWAPTCIVCVNGTYFSTNSYRGHMMSFDGAAWYQIAIPLYSALDNPVFIAATNQLAFTYVVAPGATNSEALLLSGLCGPSDVRM